VKGIGLGFVTPFCTYSAIPMLIGLRAAQVPAAGYVAFIVAAPVLDPILFGALVIIVGLDVALTYVAVVFTAALVIALLAHRLDIERHLKPVGQPALVHSSRVPELIPPSPTHTDPRDECDRSCATTGQEPWRGIRAEAVEAMWSATALLRSFGPILLLGVAIGVAIELLLPSDVVAAIAGENSPYAIPIAAGLGTPLYLSTELLIPIAQSLSVVGVGIGAIVSLTIAGAGANIPEFVILGRLAKPRLLAVFVAYVFTVAVVGGLLAQAVAA
jgi:uncharacterized membrane protein YraQ (UPF0718 family)